MSTMDGLEFGRRMRAVTEAMWRLDHINKIPPLQGVHDFHPSKSQTYADLAHVAIKAIAEIEEDEKAFQAALESRP